MRRLTMRPTAPLARWHRAYCRAHATIPPLLLALLLAYAFTR